MGKHTPSCKQPEIIYIYTCKCTIERVEHDDVERTNTEERNNERYSTEHHHHHIYIYIKYN